MSLQFGRRRAILGEWNRAWSKFKFAVVEDDSINKIGFEKGSIELRAGFEQNASDIAPMKDAQNGVQIETAGDISRYSDNIRSHFLEQRLIL